MTSRGLLPGCGVTTRGAGGFGGHTRDGTRAASPSQLGRGLQRGWGGSGWCRGSCPAACCCTVMGRLCPLWAPVSPPVKWESVSLSSFMLWGLWVQPLGSKCSCASCLILWVRCQVGNSPRSLLAWLCPVHSLLCDGDRARVSGWLWGVGARTPPETPCSQLGWGSRESWEPEFLPSASGPEQKQCLGRRSSQGRK